MPRLPLSHAVWLPGGRGAGTCQGAKPRPHRVRSHCRGPQWRLLSRTGISVPTPALSPGTCNALWLLEVPKPAQESPEEGEEPGELSFLSHFVIVAKETSSQDLAWNMSASAGPHIHLTETALKAGAGTDKGRDGGGRLHRGHRRSGSTVALL